MKFETLILVADKFVDFTADKKAITVSQLYSMLELPQHILPGPVKLVPGQGISDEDIVRLTAKIDSQSTPRRHWDVSELSRFPNRAELRLSHKREPCNTLIGTPIKLDDDRFRMDLCVDENCELMGDHQTGQHIQGMVLIEAARQAFLAVTEAFFLNETENKVYFVISSVTTEFLGFVFPIRTHIDYRVVSKDINAKRQKFSVEVETVQSGEVRTRSAFSFTVYPEYFISEREAVLARNAVDVLLRDLAQPVSAVIANHVA